ncbi:MAG: restriction endonuclease, partial [Thermoproteota archaeon]
CIEILADRVKEGPSEPRWVDTVIAMEAIAKMGLPIMEVVVPVEPDSDVRNQILARFYNIEKPSERNIVIEQAITTLIETGLGKENLIGRKRKREVDLVFTDTTARGITVGVIIKALKPQEALRIDSIEPLIDLAKSRKLNKLILLTTSPLDPNSQNALKQFENVKIVFLDDNRVSTLIYVSQIFKNLSRPERLTPETSLEVLRKINLIG